MENFQVATTLTRKMRDELEALAASHDRSLAGEIRVALKRYLREHENGKAAA